MKSLMIFFVILAMLFNVTAFASTNRPLKNLGEGLDEIAYGQIEVPDSVDETGTKGTPAYSKTTAHTKDDAGRGIARFVGGLWKIATFWYPEDD